MANGICDNLLLTVFFSLQCPSVIAPAMDEDMWKHGANKKNTQILKERGVIFLPVGNGDLASGLSGEGRMSEPEMIIKYLKGLFQNSKEFVGNKVVISAGPTREAIDPVRFISNYSSGKMGIAIAEEFHRRGASVTLVLGPTNEIVSNGINVLNVTTAEEMFSSVMDNSTEADILCMAAAVADYVPEMVADQKIKKSGDSLQLQLTKSKDILFTLGSKKTSRQTLIGFALETENEAINARKKLGEKNADIIVMNSLRDTGSGFGFDTNKIVIFEKNGDEASFPLQSKKETARVIVDFIHRYRHE
jgi:phosphopantothenoylcysteine decarboxylase/phosphopantothenate--cysteine ligase